MRPIICQIGPFTIYSYGLAVALAFFTVSFLLSRRMKDINRPPDFAWNMCFWIFCGGIIGGRAVYILFNLSSFLDNPLEIFKLWHGGLIWYGGFAGGLLSAIIYLKKHKVPALLALDLISPYIALGQAIGRIGCLLNGCCYGRPAKWGIYFPRVDDYLIPTQIFSTLALIVIFVILRLMQDEHVLRDSPAYGGTVPAKAPRNDGFIFTAYLLLYSTKRFFMEFARADSARAFFSLTIFQIISITIFISAFILWNIFLKPRMRKKAGA